MEILEQIKLHDAAVRREALRCGRQACPRCEGQPGEFRLHERRARRFRVIVERMVKDVLTFLLRWKCPLCNRTFTEYPPFAAPYKRYVLPEVAARAGRYAEEDATTYRGTTRDRGMAILHEGDSGQREGKGLSWVSVWRWVTWLGGLKETLRRAIRLIRQKDAASDIARRVYRVASSKYRSDERRAVVERCKRLLATGREYRRLFGTSMFLQLGTGGAGG